MSLHGKTHPAEKYSIFHYIQRYVGPVSLHTALPKMLPIATLSRPLVFNRPAETLHRTLFHAQKKNCCFSPDFSRLLAHFSRNFRVFFSSFLTQNPVQRYVTRAIALYVTCPGSHRPRRHATRRLRRQAGVEKHSAPTRSTHHRLDGAASTNVS